MQKKLLFFFCSIFACLLFFNGAKAQVSSTDSLALVDLYNSTNGNGWQEHTNWLSGPVSTWYGITLSNGRVTKINLNSDLLKGTIPPSFGNLTGLTEVYLASNSGLTGALPSSIGKLVNLQIFWAFSDQLNGVFPSSFGNLASIINLNVSGNQFISPLPASMKKLMKLTTLNIGFNKFNGSLPPFLFSLPSLTFAGLQSNQFTQKGNAQISGKVRPFTLSLYFNLFTFDGLESLVQKVDSVILNPQANLTIHQHGNQLAVSAGGTLRNNTYTWTQVGTSNTKTITGDSTFTQTVSGTYQVAVTNAIVGNRLTLRSSNFNFVTPSATTEIAISLSPNPASNLLTLDKLDNKADIKITIADRSGYVQLVTTSHKQSNLKLHIEKLKTGIYFLNLNDGKNVKTVQFMKE